MGRDVVIPNAVIIGRTDASGQLTPAAINAIAEAQRQVQITGASRDSYIPIVYGGYERIGGLLYLARVYNGKLVLAIILCEGTIQEIGTVDMNDAALPAGVIVTKYLGDQVAVDATLASAIPGFTETLNGTAYMVCQIPPGVSQGFPRFTALVKGLQVYDPRGTPTWAWSDNPALILADFLTNTTFGAKKSVDWTAVGVAADFCDAMIGSPAEKRSTLTISLPDRRDVKEWINILRAYVPCWCLDDGALVTLVADAARASDHIFTASNIDSSPPPKLKKRGVRDVPTVVEIGYTRTDVTPWATGYAEANTGSGIRRKARIEMPGIRRYSQARRFAIERLNHYVLEDLSIEFAVFEDGLKVREGDVVTVTDDIGIASKDFRVLEAKDRGFGRWLISGREYDPAAYSTAVETAPATPDTGLPDPRNVLPATGLTITETIYLEKNIAADSLARGLIYQSRFDISWTATVYAYPCTYRVQIFNGATVVHEGSTSGTSYASPAVQQGNTYTVKVIVRSGLGFESATLSGSQVALGKLLAPGDVPAITQSFEIGGEVFLQWSPAIDIDIERYEWRYGPTSGFSWGSASFIDRVDGLRARFKGLPIGTWRFAVKALDSVGNYSPTEATVDITITSDADAFLQSKEFTSPTLTNMQLIPQLEGVNKLRWATGVVSDVFTSVEPDPFNSGGNPVISYHASATSKFVGESWDFGSTVTGDWSLTPNTTDVTGTATYAMETSPDGSTWTAQPGVAWKGATRFIRPVIQTLTTGTMIITAPPKISLSALSKSESGAITTLSSGGKLVQLTGQYSGAQDLQVTAINSSAARSVSADRVLLHAQIGMMLQYDYNGAGDNYEYRTFSLNARVVAAGDYFEYDVFIDPNSPTTTTYSNGGMLITFTDVSNTAAGTAADGYSFALPATGFDALARGQWVSRKLNMAAYVGKTCSAFTMLNSGDAVSGTARTLIRNARFTDGAGTDRLSIYGTAGEPTYNASSGSALVTNIRCGPSNSFNLYAFDSSGTQVAQETQYSFRGF